MKLNEYPAQALKTLGDEHAYGTVSATLMAQVLGLVGESGEVAEKFKKILRDKAGTLSDEDKTELLKELGDILWYVNSVAYLLGSDLEYVVNANIEKLASRQARGTLSGNGDNR